MTRRQNALSSVSDSRQKQTNDILDITQKVEFHLQTNGVYIHKNTLYDLWKDTSSSWYTKALAYWDDQVTCPADHDGILGGFGHVNEMDIEGSKHFLRHLKMKNHQRTFSQAIDMGAGIGRVAKQVLMSICTDVDLLEPSPRLLQASRTYVGNSHTGTFYGLGLHQIDQLPKERKYDLIWCQWVLVHLTDVDMIAFLLHCKNLISSTGLLIVKENLVAKEDVFDIDHLDSSISRSALYYESLFMQGGWTILYDKDCPEFPTELYPVHFYALTPTL